MTSAEYLLASRSVSWIPVSFFLSVGIMGITENMYVHGITFGFQTLSEFDLPIPINAEIFSPIFQDLKLFDSLDCFFHIFYSKRFIIIIEYVFLLFFFVLVKLLSIVCMHQVWHLKQVKIILF